MKHKFLLLIILFQFTFYSCSSNNSSDDDNSIVVNLELSKSELKMNVREDATLTVVKAPSSNETLVWTTSVAVITAVPLC